MDDEYNKYIEYYKDYKDQYGIDDIKKILSDNNLNELLDKEENSIETEYLYKSETHGIKHNRRVLFHAFIICFFENITGDDFRIIMDACKYHDVGRVNDENDPEHGIRSSEIIANRIMVNNVFYNTNNNINYLRAIVEVHSHPDDTDKFYFNKYDLDNYERYVKLYSVLKDADGLDRSRLYSLFPEIEWLNPKYLRTKQSKKMIKLAHELNYLTK